MSEMKQSLHTYSRLLQVTRAYWLALVIGIVATMGVSFVDAGFAWLIKPIIDKGFIARDPIFIHYMPFLIIITFILRGICGFSSNYYMCRVSRNVVMDFRQQIFATLLGLPARFYDRHSSSQLISTIIYNVEQVAQASSDALLTILREGSLLLGLIIVMFWVNWRLFLLFLFAAVLISVIVKWSGGRLKRLSRIVQDSVAEVTHVAAEGINAYKVVRLFGGQKYEQDKFNKTTGFNRQRELKIVITNSIVDGVVQFMVAILIAILLLLATHPSFRVTAGDFGTVISSMIMLLRPMRRLTMVISVIQKGVAGAESIFKIIDEKPEENSGTYHIKRAQGAINFSNVWFNYNNQEKNILQDISFSAKPGQTIALVGHSGSGKTTLINLLPRFYDIQGGLIKIDGMDIKKYDLKSLRNQFAFVSQHPVLFNDTIAHNIAYGQFENVTEQDIIHAAKLAHAYEFIEQFPNGLDTLIGENGVLLSGGQRQRIAIARALLKKAPILILDEATSALDTHSERKIQAALDSLMQQSTTMVIAHRLSTIENADWIIVLDQGRLIEQGTHTMLLAKKGLYADLHQLQFNSHVYANVEALT